MLSFFSAKNLSERGFFRRHLNIGGERTNRLAGYFQHRPGYKKGVSQEPHDRGKCAKDGNGCLHLPNRKLTSAPCLYSWRSPIVASIPTFTTSVLSSRPRKTSKTHVYIHFFGDGRDTAPRSSAKYAKELLDFIAGEGRKYRHCCLRDRGPLPPSRRGTKKMKRTRSTSQSSFGVMREESRVCRVASYPLRLADPF